MAALPLTRHTFHGEWDYALRPQPTPAVPAARSSGPVPQWARPCRPAPRLPAWHRVRCSTSPKPWPRKGTPAAREREY
jgi:hypothetical protein